VSVADLAARDPRVVRVMPSSGGGGGTTMTSTAAMRHAGRTAPRHYTMRQREADLAAIGSDEEEEFERMYTIDVDGRAPWKVSSPPSPSQQQYFITLGPQCVCVCVCVPVSLC
jgi:hypothetical protein